MKSFSVLLVALVMSMFSFQSFAGPKTWTNDLITLECTLDLSKNGAIGTHKICDLPDAFVVTDIVVNVPTALTGGGSLVLGEDGAGDADGYFTDLDAVVGVLKGSGALVASGKAHKVDPAKDGVLATIATTAYTAGVVYVNVIGFQGK